MSAEQIGRWTSVAATDFTQDSGPGAALALACSIHAMNELSKSVEPLPPVARLIVARPDGTPLGVFSLDDQDAEILIKRVHEMSADPLRPSLRYGPGRADAQVPRRPKLTLRPEPRSLYPAAQMTESIGERPRRYEG
ncbi:hypothetical protein AR457_00630 [Streptomyces agglomeratus]|uniref:Uncharacterized protein n=1 Tax=Streptomyces agglomeratus TaxID=285458 RepID=A0A1E5P158_9ACTN|nr:hypothetical protein [Streptomyces agglomeratus]OEJ23270.1 hypothetical protein AS594_00840 [Streptomyces agglomeratus]OEJ42842.1 hypothetical protein AR457_00630 [Streptomyces agglomeratus]OEJ55224.1 hypothetical protein BGK72_35050 [Streptomyces agglomeratus]OEJ62598.1 hypothetical protein BGM19_36055 [Streptomyces agglomeratus]